MKMHVLAAGIAAVLSGAAAGAPGGDLSYPIIDTGQERCYGDEGEIAYPGPGERFFGQDAQYVGHAPSYRDNGDGTVSDLVTGLMWQKSPDLENKRTWEEARAGAAALHVGGHRDWRLPTIKELYSLIDFRGSSALRVPYVDSKFFAFRFGEEARGERVIDAQYWSSDEYVGAGDPLVFGVNFADGRIKGYPKVHGPRGPMKEFVRYVRGNPEYGKNHFRDNGEGTVTDAATGLTWMKADSGKAMLWEEALKYAEDLEFAGQDDWRLPNAKELQSLVDYTRAPAARDPAKRSAAIDPIFSVSDADGWFWTGTTLLEGRPEELGGAAVYVAFGRAFGYPRGAEKTDVHGAGAQRSDPKKGDPADFSGGRGPQRDEIRIRNFARAVRGGAATLRTTPPGGVAAPAPAASPGRRFLTRLDKNGDGKVSREEFDGPPEHFRDFDRNGDGFITEEEAPTGPPPGRR